MKPRGLLFLVVMMIAPIFLFSMAFYASSQPEALFGQTGQQNVTIHTAGGWQNISVNNDLIFVMVMAGIVFTLFDSIILFILIKSRGHKNPASDVS